MMMKIYGMIPKNPFEELVMIEVMMEVESLRAVGENSSNTPILQMRKKRM